MVLDGASGGAIWAEKAGIGVYRMGVDWGRLTPNDPFNLECEKKSCPIGVQNFDALQRYREILKDIKNRKMKVMLTLFHHSLPVWAIDKGGWANQEVREHFIAFSKDVYDELGDLVDQWVIFNEPALFNSLSYVVGIWPHSQKGLNVLDQRFFGKALVNMVEAHKRIYDYIHQKDSKAFVGIAKNMALYKGYHIHDKVISNFLKYRMNWEFLDRTVNYMDFIGINYYGEEIVKNFSLFFDEEKEYSEAGRGVNPRGLYEILLQTHDRYNIKQRYRDLEDNKHIPIIITENGVSDSTDKIRPAYLIEHLLAVHNAIKEGVPVLGYIHWTLSDNWEWADGYCPKFGLLSVDRTNNTRIARDSFFLFQSIARNKWITQSQRLEATEKVLSNAGMPKYMCRDTDGQTALDVPRQMPIADFEWGVKEIL